VCLHIGRSKGRAWGPKIREPGSRTNRPENVWAELSQIAGVETFDLGDPGKVGLLIEAEGLEQGVGVGFETLGGDLYVNPQLGFTSGNLLSSGTAEPGIVGDGIVPNLTMNYGTDDLEGQIYFGWYLPLRDEAPTGGSTLEYIHYWANGGKKFGGYFSAGLHFEELRLSGGSDVDSQDGYQWLGPYFQVANDTLGLRFSY